MSTRTKPWSWRKFYGEGLVSIESILWEGSETYSSSRDLLKAVKFTLSEYVLKFY